MISKMYRRIVPLVVLILFCSILDRINLGFAAVTMNAELGLTNAEFGMAAGFFSIGYALFGIPSTLMLHKVGAQRWIAITMVAWALCSAATALVYDARSLMIVRFLLGVAEAGLTPGIVLYLSYWFPSAWRGRVFGLVFVIQPLTVMIGGPLSSGLLQLDGWLGLSGWHWLFIVEAAPTILLAIVVALCLTDRPEAATWLDPSEKAWIEQRLESERSSAAADRNWDVLRQRRIWTLAAAFLAIGTAGMGAFYFLPLIIRSTGLSVSASGVVAGVPGLVSLFTIPLWGLWTDRSSCRACVTAAACLLMVAGFVGGALLLPSPWALVPLTVALAGFFGVFVPFWTLPTGLLQGAAAAVGIAFVNIAGNLGHFTGPALVGMLSNDGRGYGAAMISLAVVALLAAGLVLLLRGPPVGDRS